jgi:hypothetical protein
MPESTGQYLAASTRPREISDSPLLKIQGIPICSVVVRDGEIFLRFKDKWKGRIIASGRTSNYIELPLSEFDNLARELAHVKST